MVFFFENCNKNEIIENEKTGKKKHNLYKNTLKKKVKKAPTQD